MLRYKIYAIYLSKKRTILTVLKFWPQYCTLWQINKNHLIFVIVLNWLDKTFEPQYFIKINQVVGFFTVLMNSHILFKFLYVSNKLSYDTFTSYNMIFIFFSVFIFLLFHSPRCSWNKSAKMRKNSLKTLLIKILTCKSVSSKFNLYWKIVNRTSDYQSERKDIKQIPDGIIPFVVYVLIYIHLWIPSSMTSKG